MYRVVLFIIGLCVSLTMSAQKYHDAAAFDCLGNVKCIITETGYIFFNKDGSLNKKKSTALDVYDKYTITRNSKGYPVTIKADANTITLKYDENWRIIKKSVTGADRYTITYSYNPSALKGHIDVVETVVSGVAGISEEVVYKDFYRALSSRGVNWERYESMSRDSYRAILYYDTFGKQISSQTNVKLFDLLEKPFQLDNGFDIFGMKCSKGVKFLKSNGIECEKVSGRYEMFDPASYYCGYPLEFVAYWLYKKEVPNWYGFAVTRLEQKQPRENVYNAVLNEMVDSGIVLNTVIFGGKKGPGLLHFKYKGRSWYIRRNNASEKVEFTCKNDLSSFFNIY